MITAPDPDDFDEAGDGLEDDPCATAVVAAEAAAQVCDSGDSRLHEAAAALRAHHDAAHNSRSKNESFSQMSPGAREGVVGTIESLDDALAETLESAKQYADSNPALAYADRAIARGFSRAKECLQRLLKADLTASKRLMERKRTVEVDLDCVREVD